MIRVLGAGIIGLSVADELVRRGLDVQVVDPAPGSGASYAAAGMLSPAGELWHGEEVLHSLGRRSVELWPAYAARLGVSLHRGTVLAAADRDDLHQIERHVALMVEHGDTAELLTRSGLEQREPRVGRVVGGAWLPDDHSVDPRQVVSALIDRLRDRIVPTAVGPAALTVIATGAQLPSPYAHLVRGVRGEILRLRTHDLPSHPIRGLVRGEPVYLVPRPGGELVVGATQEEHDGEPLVTAEGVWRILDAARRLLPGIDRAEVVELTARDRPGTRDNLPLVGPTDDPSVLLAAGHFRHGVLLAPLTALAIADFVEKGRVFEALDPRRMTGALR
jgi:glycine oxidase